jgi:hypothetical protein
MAERLEYLKDQKFIFPYVAQAGSEALPASYPMGIGDSFPGSKAARV